MKQHFEYLLQGLFGLVAITIILLIIIGLGKLCLILPIVGIPLLIILCAWFIAFASDNF